MTVPTSQSRRAGSRSRTTRAASPAAKPGPPAVGSPTSSRTPSPTADSGRPGAARLVVLARVALLPPAVCYGVAVVLAGVVAALASGTSPGGEPGLGQALAVGVPLWLVAHLVPLQLSGVPFGVLPLAPALVLGVGVAAVARGAVGRLGRGRGALAPVVATAAAAHAAIGVLAAALLTPESLVDASPALAGVVCGLLAGLAALAGAARPCGLLGGEARWPGWLRHGWRAGLAAAAALVTAGAALLLATLLADVPAVARVLADIAPQTGSGAGLTLLTMAYLPNAVIAAASWVMGPGVSIGLASAAPTGAVAGPMPPIPLLATMPSEAPPSWVGLTFAVPLAIGSLVGWRLAPAAPDVATRLRAVAAAAGTAAVVLALLAALAGGRLGAGLFDPVSIPPGWVLLAAAGWVLVPGAVVALLAVPSGTAPPPVPAAPAPVVPAHGPAADDAVGTDPDLDDPDDPDDLDDPEAGSGGTGDAPDGTDAAAGRRGSHDGAGTRPSRQAD